jgi:tetratricopeptide (TPR) repeat protein
VGPLPDGCGNVYPGLDGQADAGDLAVCAPLIGLLARREKFEDAIDQFRKVLEIKPDYPEAYYNLGNAFVRSGKVDEAIAHYRKALEIKPDYVKAHVNLGAELAGRGQVEEAIAHYRKALEIEPNYLDAHYNLGSALAGRGNLDEAIEHYRTALELATASRDSALAEDIRAKMKRAGRGD